MFQKKKSFFYKIFAGLVLVCKRFVGSTVVGSPVSDHEDAVTVHGQAGKHIIDIFFIGNTFFKTPGCHGSAYSTRFTECPVIDG